MTVRTNPAPRLPARTPQVRVVIPRARPRRAAPPLPQAARLLLLRAARAAFLRARAVTPRVRPRRAVPPLPRVALLRARAVIPRARPLRAALPLPRAARAAFLPARVVIPRARPHRAALPLPRAARPLLLRVECPRWRPPITKPSAVAAFADCAGTIGGCSSSRWGSATPLAADRLKRQPICLLNSLSLFDFYQ